MLVITDMRARLRGNDARIVSLIMDFERLKDAPLTKDQREAVELVIAYLQASRDSLGELIGITPQYEPPTEHHESEDE